MAAKATTPVAPKSDEELPSLEKMIDFANENGWRMLNLFQLVEKAAPTGNRWQCNFRKGNEYFEFGVGPTPRQAMANALVNCAKHRVARCCGDGKSAWVESERKRAERKEENR